MHARVPGKLEPRVTDLHAPTSHSALPVTVPKSKAHIMEGILSRVCFLKGNTCLPLPAFVMKKNKQGHQNNLPIWQEPFGGLPTEASSSRPPDLPKHPHFPVPLPQAICTCQVGQLPAHSQGLTTKPCHSPAGSSVFSINNTTFTENTASQGARRYIPPIGPPEQVKGVWLLPSAWKVVGHFAHLPANCLFRRQPR